VPLDRLLPHVPTLLHAGIKSSRYYADKTASLLIQSDDSRRQTQNKDTCFRKLHELLVEIGRQTVPGETSEGQTARVKMLKRAENEGRLRAKKLASNKKSSRSKSLDD
jgi:peptidyl-tRNA hydrolase ICT1